MGLLPEVQASAQPITAYQVVAPNRRTTTAPIAGAHQALVVPRLKLDNLILQRAIRGGATFRAGVSVTRVDPTEDGVRVHTEKGDSFDARVGIVATGAATGVLTR